MVILYWFSANLTCSSIFWSSSMIFLSHIGSNFSNFLSSFALKLPCVHSSTLLALAPPSLCYFLLSPWGEVEIGPHLSSRHSCTNGYTCMHVRTPHNCAVQVEVLTPFLYNRPANGQKHTAAQTLRLKCTFLS